MRNLMNIVKDGQIPVKKLYPTEKVQVVTTPKLFELSHEILKNALRCDHMNFKEKYATEDLCGKFLVIFYLKGDTITCTDA